MFKPVSTKTLCPYEETKNRGSSCYRLAHVKESKVSELKNSSFCRNVINVKDKLSCCRSWLLVLGGGGGGGVTTGSFFGIHFQFWQQSKQRQHPKQQSTTTRNSDRKHSFHDLAVTINGMLLYHHLYRRGFETCQERKKIFEFFRVKKAALTRCRCAPTPCVSTHAYDRPCTHVKEPTVHVRVRSITETPK